MSEEMCYFGESSDNKNEDAPSKFTIKKFEFEGSGCESGSIKNSVSRNSFTLSFSDFDAEVGPNSSSSDIRKSCRITMALDVPNGWKFSIDSLTSRGSMDLDNGIAARLRTNYSFDKKEGEGEFSSNENGEFTGIFKDTDDVDSNDADWSACGSSDELKIYTSVHVRNNDLDSNENAEGSIFKDSEDKDGDNYKQVWGIKWKTCD